MASGAYSFIDIAVLDAVRARFAAGDALAILSSDLETVLWANGAGAQVFGYPDIEAIMDAPTRLGLAARRQIAATPNFPDIGRDKAVTVRLSSGSTSRAASFLATSIRLPRGERAILFAIPAGPADALTLKDIAERALAGFSEAGYFAALVDEAGVVAASTAGFSALGIEQDALRALAADVRGERDRLVKRLVPAGRARYPAGFARLTDDPAQHLLVVVDDDQSAGLSPDQAAPQAGRESGHAAPLEQDNQRREPAPLQEPVPASSAEAVSRLEAATPAAPREIDRWDFRAGDGAGRKAPPSADILEPVPAAAEPMQPAEPTPPLLPERTAAPVRFVWRTDAEGRFSAISADFTAAVGADAAGLIGHRFRDVAIAFGFDGDGEIAGLLERRDTWSGRSVLWPIAGTGLRAPVDLAALPVYARDRSFEGFRGFGVARISDATADAGAPRPVVTDTPATDAAAPSAPEQVPAKESRTDADPFRGEVPALVIDNTPDRRFTDKVIKLAGHRQPGVERGLSPVERSAFREIGDRLKKDGVGTRPKPPARSPEADDRHPQSLFPLRLEQDAARVEREEAEAAPADDGAYRAGTIIAEPAGSLDAGPDEAAPLAEDAAAPDISESEQVESAGDDDDDVNPVALPVAADHVPASPAPPPLQSAGYMPAAFPEDRAAVDVSILARLPVPVLIHSADRLHYANREFLDLTGYGSLADLEEAGGLAALFADPYKAGDGAGFGGHQLRLRSHQGVEFPVEALLQSVPWQSGKALLLAIRPALHPVVPEPSETADNLELRIAELRTILDTATDGVVLIANDGTIRSISRPGEALFGLDSSHVTGRPFATLFAVESQRAARDYLNGLSDNGVASVLNDGREVIGREAQGRFIPLFMTIGKLPDDSGYCAVLRDITHWKRAEEELTQARAQAERTSSQKTDFLARVSHEIRTPLNAIIGFSELMMDEKFGPVGNERYRDYLRDINRSGNHVLDLVNDLLDISKIEAGEQEMSYEAVSLNDALTECVAMLQPQANRERVIIRSSFASRLPEVVADIRSIRQIALNLLANAIRYTPAGGQVIVSTAYETSGDIVLRVRDTGIGMSQAEVEQALKPFKQINALKRGRGDGTGLGLPLTKAMVEANRARFSINSTPGEGTMVEIAFPSTRVLAD